MSSTPLRTAWLIVILLLPVALLNYLDRQMLASMKSSIMTDIPSIKIQENWGLILGLFKWVYACLSPIGGFIADRFGKRYTICGSLFVWSAVTWWTGHVDTFNELLWARSLMGISEAFYFPAALALIADYHIGPTRSRAVGLHQMAIYFGVIVGGFGGYVADNPMLGWRFAFNTCGIFGMIYAIPLVFLIKDIPQTLTTSETQRLNPGQTLLALVSNASFILLVLCFTLPAMSAWIVRDWMPAILKDVFKLQQGEAGVASTMYWQLAAIAGALLGGWLADRWVLRTQRGRIYVSALGMCMMVPAIMGMGNAPTLFIAVLFLMLFGLGWGFFDCNNMPILCQIVRPELRATGYGIMNFVSISCGGLADWGFGILRDRAVPLNQSFNIFASVALVSIVLVLLIRPRKEL